MLTKKIQIKTAGRYKKRKRGVAVGKNLYKTLTEPITNSDDAYRRPAYIKTQGSIEDPVLIKVIVDRRSRTIRVIDHATGMTAKDLEEKFKEYGADKSGASHGEAVRGLFGQGITDVLLYHSNGSIKSIKDGQASVVRFFEKGENDYIEVEKVDEAIEDIAEKWGIESNHGTCVEFTLDEDTKVARHDYLIEKLRSFYMLRLIHNDDKRLVELVDISTKGIQSTTRLRYSFPKGDLVKHEEMTMQYKGYAPIYIDIQLYRAHESLESIGDARESGLLVYDNENAVYDLTLFGLETLPGADKYFGYMKLAGAREIILDKINDKKHPEEILSDSRDGFNKQHELYKELESKMRDWLYPILSVEKRKTSEEGLSKHFQERQQRVFNELNKAYSEIIGEEAGGTIYSKEKQKPAGGLAFARNAIKISPNKRYALQVAIDTDIIKAGEVVSIKSSKSNVAFSPDKIMVEEVNNKLGVLVKTINIIGKKPGRADTIIASYKDRKDSVVVSIVRNDIFYPEAGLEFHPSYFRAVAHKEGKLSLFADPAKVAKEGIILLTSSNEHIELLDKKIKVSEADQVEEGVYRFDIRLKGNLEGETGIIQAVYNDISTEARVDIRARIDREPPTKSGKFRGWDFDDALSGSPFQAAYDSNPTSAAFGYILLNPEHPINKEYFGDSPQKKDIEDSRTKQLYLAEIILNESLQVVIPDALQKGSLPRRNGDLDVLYYIAQKKYELGSVVYKHFVLEKSKREVEREKKLKQIKSSLDSEEHLTEGLKKREKEMVEMQLGLNNKRPHTLEEIGRKFDITRERARQIIDKAITGKTQNNKDSKKINVKQVLNEKEARRVALENIELQEKIIRVVAKFYGLGYEEIKIKSRKKDIVKTRSVAVYLLRDIIHLSFPRIGEIFDQDHSTIMHAYSKVSYEIEENPEFAAQIKELKDMIE